MRVSLFCFVWSKLFFFEWANIFKTKFPKNTTFVIISLNFGNSQWSSSKNFFIVSMIGLHTWNNKVRSKIWGKRSILLFLFENQFFFFLDLKLKLPFQPFTGTWKLETVLRSKILPQMRTLWSNQSLVLKLVKHVYVMYILTFLCWILIRNHINNVLDKS